MSRARRPRPGDRADTGTWPMVASAALPQAQREVFKARADAVRRFSRREPLRRIDEATGVSYSAVRRLFERCLETHEDGRLQGFRALIPYGHVKRYRRSAPILARGATGKVGAFAQLLERYPELEALIVEELREHRVVLRQGATGLVASGLAALRRKFREACLQLGLTATDYPLSQRHQGERSLAAAVKRIATRTFEAAASAALAPKRSGGVSERDDGPPLAVTAPFDAVEFDGHRVDVRLRIVFERVAGIEESFEIDRIWLLTILDVCSRAVLGYHLVLEPEYSRFDVLKTVERAVTPWQRPALTIPGLRYAAGAGMPSERLPELGYATWNWFRFDNARANLALDTLRVLTEIIGCGAHAGPAYRPNERPHIERFFGTFAAVLAHRLPGTTGKDTTDPRRRIAKLTTPALVRLDELMELTAVAIANYNAAAHAGLGGRSPLETLVYFVRERAMPLRWLAEPLRRNLCLLQQVREGHVRGSVARGERPYVYFYGARYTSHRLAGRADLIGQPVWVYFDPEDVRALRLFDRDGREIDAVEVQGGWRHSAHTLRMRKEILALVRDRTLRPKPNEDPVPGYLQHLRDAARRRRRSASKAETGRRSVNAGPPSPQAPPGPPRASTAPPPPRAPIGAEEVKASGPVKGKRLAIGSGQVFSR